MELEALVARKDEVLLKQQLLRGELAPQPDDSIQRHASDTGLAAMVQEKVQRSQLLVKKNGKGPGGKKNQRSSGEEEEEEDDPVSIQRRREEQLYQLFDPQHAAAREAALQLSLARAQVVASELRAAVSQTMKTLLGSEEPAEVAVAVGVDVPSFVVGSHRRQTRRKQVESPPGQEEQEDAGAEESGEGDEEVSNEVQVVTLEQRLRDITAFLRDPASSNVASYIPRAVRRGVREPDSKEQMSWFEEQVDTVGEESLLVSTDSFSVLDKSTRIRCGEQVDRSGTPPNLPQRRSSRRVSTVKMFAEPEHPQDESAGNGEEGEGDVPAQPAPSPPPPPLPRPIAEEVDEHVMDICRDIGLLDPSKEWISLSECDEKVQEAKKKILEDVRRTFRVRYSLVCVREFDRLTSIVADFAKEVAARDAARQKEIDELKSQLEKKLAQSESLRKKLSNLSHSSPTGGKRRATQRVMTPDQNDAKQHDAPSSSMAEAIAPFKGDVTPAEAFSVKEFGAYVSTTTTPAAPTAHPSNFDVVDDGAALALSNPLIRKLSYARHVAEQLENAVMHQHDSYEKHRQKQRWTRLQVGSVPLFRDQMIQTLTEDDLLLEGLFFVPLGPPQSHQTYKAVANRDEKMTEVLREAAKSVSVDWSLPSSATASPKSKKPAPPQPELGLVQAVQEGVEELEALRGRMMRRILDSRCEKPVPSPTTTIVAVAEKLFHSDSQLCDAFTEANVAVRGVLRSFVPRIVQQSQALVDEVTAQARAAAQQAAETQQRLTNELNEVKARAAENEQRLNASLLQLQQSMSMSMAGSVGPSDALGQGISSPPRFGAAAAKHQAKLKAAQNKEEEAARLALQEELRRAREESSLLQRDYDGLLSGIFDLVRQASQAAYPDIYQAVELFFSRDRSSISAEAVSAFFSMIIEQQVTFTSTQLIPQFAADSIASTSNLSELMLSMCRSLTIDVPQELANKIEEYIVIADKVVVQSRKLKAKAGSAIVANDNAKLTQASPQQEFSMANVTQFVKDSAFCCNSMIRRLKEYIAASIRKQEEPLINAVDSLAMSLVGRLVPVPAAADDMQNAEGSPKTDAPVGEAPVGADGTAGDGAAPNDQQDATDQFQETEDELRDDVVGLVDFIIAAPRMTKPGQSLQIVAAAKKLATTFQKLHDAELKSSALLREEAEREKARRDSMVDGECAPAEPFTVDIEVATDVTVTYEKSSVAIVDVVDGVAQAVVEDDRVDAAAGPDDDDEDDEPDGGALDAATSVSTGDMSEARTVAAVISDVDVQNAAPVVVKRRKSSISIPTRSMHTQTELDAISIEQALAPVQDTQIAFAHEDVTPVADAMEQLSHTFSYLRPAKTDLEDELSEGRKEDAEEEAAVCANSSSFGDLQTSSSIVMKTWKELLLEVEGYLTAKLEVVKEEKESQTVSDCRSAAISPRPPAETKDASVMCEIADFQAPAHHASPVQHQPSRGLLPPLSPQPGRAQFHSTATVIHAKHHHHSTSSGSHSMHEVDGAANNRPQLPLGAALPQLPLKEAVLPSPRGAAAVAGTGMSPRMSPRRHQEARDQQELLLLQKKRLEDARLEQQHQAETHHVLMACLRLLLRHSRHLGKMTLPDPFEQAIPHAPPIPFSRREYDLQLMHNISRFLAHDGLLSKRRFRYAVQTMIAEQRLLRFMRWRRLIETTVLRCAVTDGVLPRRLIDYLTLSENKLRQQIVRFRERRSQAVAEQKFARSVFMTTAIAPVVVGLEQFPHQVAHQEPRNHHSNKPLSLANGAENPVTNARDLQNPKDLPPFQMDEVDAVVKTQLDSRGGTCSTAQGHRRHSSSGQGSLGIGIPLVQTPLQHDRQVGGGIVKDARASDHFIGVTTFETVEVRALHGTFSREAAGNGMGGLDDLPPLSRMPVAAGQRLNNQQRRISPTKSHAESKQDHLFSPLVAQSDDHSELLVRRNNWKGVVRVSNVLEKASTPEPLDQHALVVHPATRSLSEELSDVTGGKRRVAAKNLASRGPMQHPPHAKLLVQPQRTTIMHPERTFAASFLSGRSVVNAPK